MARGAMRLPSHASVVSIFDICGRDDDNAHGDAMQFPAR
jgi:hypothetical protein